MSESRLGDRFIRSPVSGSSWPHKSLLTVRSCPLVHLGLSLSNGQVNAHSLSYALCPKTHIRAADRPYLALGLEGSANKLGAGIIKHAKDGSSTVLSNIRHTYITPPGEGFQPRDTALHHRQWIMGVIKDALQKAGVSIHDLDCICYTKGVWGVAQPFG